MINYNYLFPRKFYSTFVDYLYPYFEWQRVPAHVCRNFNIVEYKEVLLPTIFFRNESPTKPLPRVEWLWLAIAIGEWLSRREYGEIEAVLVRPYNNEAVYCFGAGEYRTAKRQTATQKLCLTVDRQNRAYLFLERDFHKSLLQWNPGVNQN